MLERINQLTFIFHWASLSSSSAYISRPISPHSLFSHRPSKFEYTKAKRWNSTRRTDTQSTLMRAIWAYGRIANRRLKYFFTCSKTILRQEIGIRITKINFRTFTSFWHHCFLGPLPNCWYSYVWYSWYSYYTEWEIEIVRVYLYN